MRYEILFDRSALLVAALMLAACTSHEPPKPPPQQQQPASRFGSTAMSPSSQRPGPSREKPKPPEPPKPPMGPEEVLVVADTDKDGALSYQEQLNFALHEADARFSRIDRDQDGRLSSQELEEADKRRQAMNPDGKTAAGGNGAPPPQSPQSLLSMADANQDGVVDSSENRAIAQQQASKRFQSGDKNGDGRLERGEMQARPGNSSVGN